jgi:hypothetical protein
VATQAIEEVKQVSLITRENQLHSHMPGLTASLLLSYEAVTALCLAQQVLPSVALQVVYSTTLGTASNSSPTVCYLCLLFMLFGLQGLAQKRGLAGPGSHKLHVALGWRDGGRECDP